MVPSWAISRIRYEFARQPGGESRPLLHLDIADAEAGMDARARHLPTSPVSGTPRGWPVVLAQLPPELAVATEPGGPFTGGAEEGLPGFFYRVHRLLRRGGILLTACRQQHRENGELIDPCGRLIACARAAGFVYRQHILIVHATASGNRLHPTDDAPDVSTTPAWRHRPIHTDLLLFAPA
ncbi:hypothetical protein [Streptomyces sp. SBT349]|uniref:hypothetical protein n=1 Tax=Streptomyces sp. SBT349 TaxID=1580539 RepID=UPI001F416236|nr:hypothetical protein [Streptomyces sp. SBT349]